MDEPQALPAGISGLPLPPLISIITSTLNAAAMLPHTIESLRAQTCRDFEWIVVDGASTDATVDLLRDCLDVVAILISEPDTGIYDAWNKACRRARGEWLIFMGAGDELTDANTLAICSGHLRCAPASTSFVYGRLELISPQARSVIDVFGSPWQEICNKWEIGRPALPPHGATFHRRNLFDEPDPFDLRFAIAADSHFLLRQIRNHPPHFMPVTVTRSPLGGVSFRLDTARLVATEIATINRDLGVVPPLAHRMFDALRLSVISTFNQLPLRVAHRMADLARRMTGKPRRWTVR
ncbi:MAG: glycosyltransferase family 2 protein [Candidatus Accumulibacter propinquus]|jgi:glycosyltransferase involved in cell wall biosynthesis